MHPSSRALPADDGALRLVPGSRPAQAPERPLRRAERVFNVLAVGLDVLNRWRDEEAWAAEGAEGAEGAVSRQEIMDAVIEAAQTMRMLGIDARVRTCPSADVDEDSLQWADALVIVRDRPGSPAYFSAMELAMSVSQNVVVCDPQVAERTALTMRDHRRIDVLNRADATSLALCWLETGAGGDGGTDHLRPPR